MPRAAARKLGTCFMFNFWPRILCPRNFSLKKTVSDLLLENRNVILQRKEWLWLLLGCSFIFNGLAMGTVSPHFSK